MADRESGCPEHGIAAMIGCEPCMEFVLSCADEQMRAADEAQVRAKDLAAQVAALQQDRDLLAKLAGWAQCIRDEPVANAYDGASTRVATQTELANWADAHGYIKGVAPAARAD